MWNNFRLRRKCEKLQQQWDTLTEKLSRLKEAHVLQTQADERFRLEQEIAKLEPERQQVEAQLQEAEQRLAAEPAKAPTPPRRRKTYLLVLGLLVALGIGTGWRVYVWRQAQLFPSGTFGVLVTAFEGEDAELNEKGKRMQHDLVSTLNARFRELGIQDAVARSMTLTLKSHAEARTLGEKYQAELVIWGEVNSIGVIPNLTLVRSTSKDFLPVQQETTILKDVLSFSALAEMKDMRLPPLTDEPTLFVSFVTGLKYYNKEEYEKALDYFTKSLPENPTKYIDTAPIFYYIGSVQLFTKKYDEAIANFDKALEINPKHDCIPCTYIHLGLIYYDKNDYDQAIANYTKALEIDPKNVIAYYNRGLVYGKKGEDDKALADYTQAVTLNPRFARAYTNRGIVYGKKGEDDKALADYTQAVTLNPKLTEAYANRGVVYDNKGDYDNALADYTQALTLDPKLTEAYYSRGNIYQEKGEYDKAIADYTKTIEIDSKHSCIPCTYLNRGLAYGKKGEDDKALADFTQAVTLNPNDARAYYNRGLVYGKKGEDDKALADYTQAVTLNPKLTEAYANRGVVYGKKGEDDKALADFTQAVTLNPKYAEAYTNRGVAYAAKGEVDKALADYTEAVTLDPSDAQAYYNRGITYQDKKEYDKAIADYTKVIEVDSKHSYILCAYGNRGNIYENIGDYNKALADYTQALTLDPKLVGAYNSEAWLLATCPDDKYRNGVKAIKLAQKALELEPNDAEFVDTLAAAYAEAGRFEDAIAAQEQAIKLLNTDNPPAEFIEHLKSYQAQQPWREK